MGELRPFATASELPEDCRRALRNLLIACADTKLLLGYHYGEWTFGTPALEAAIANCSLSQTELGHVRLLHGILKVHFGEDPDALVDRRAAGEFANVAFLDRELPDWATVVAATYGVDLAVTQVLHAMRASTFLPVRSVVEKMLEEERYHAHHGRGWFRSVAARGGEPLRAVEAAMQEALRSVAEWFGPAEEAEDHALLATAVKARSNADLLGDFVREVAASGSSVGVHLGLDSLEHGAWSPRTRRGRPGGPAEEILYHMRGSKNAMFRQE
jgi:phenylacetate-CoA oxygenase PaaI subunit